MKTKKYKVELIVEINKETRGTCGLAKDGKDDTGYITEEMGWIGKSFPYRINKIMEIK